MSLNRIVFAATGALACCSLSSIATLAADAIPGYVKKAVENPARPPLEIMRDANRKPADVMAFAGVKPGNVVVDLLPEGGYYTRILSKIVGPKGKVYTFVPSAGGGVGGGGREPTMIQDPSQNGPLTRMQLAYSIEDTPDFKNVTVLGESLGAFGGEFGIPQQADMVFTGGDYHLLHTKEFGDLDMVAVNKAIFRALKPGGVYMIIDYAVANGSGFSAADTLHRSDPDAVKAEVVAAGFTFDGENRATANAADDHTKVANDTDMKNDADAFIYRFRKPLSATGDKRPPKNAMDGYFGNTSASNVGATGKVTGQRERRELYHPDGTYQEFGAPGTGNNPFQSGIWYWDADGHNCMLHEFPYNQRGQVVCHETAIDKKPGDKWVEGSGRGSAPSTILKGYVYFND